MPKHVMIVGGGVGGTIIANILARHLQPSDAKVTLIESTGKHAYMPGWLYMPFNHDGLDSDHIIRNERNLLDRHVQHIRGTVTKIDAHNRELHVHYSPGLDEIVGTGGAVDATYSYDYLVLATGARLVPEDLEGLSGYEGEGWHHLRHCGRRRRTTGALHEQQRFLSLHSGNQERRWLPAHPER